MLVQRIINFCDQIEKDEDIEGNLGNFISNIRKRFVDKEFSDLLVEEDIKFLEDSCEEYNQQLVETINEPSNLNSKWNELIDEIVKEWGSLNSLNNSNHRFATAEADNNSRVREKTHLLDYGNYRFLGHKNLNKCSDKKNYDYDMDYYNCCYLLVSVFSITFDSKKSNLPSFYKYKEIAIWDKTNSLPEELIDVYQKLRNCYTSINIDFKTLYNEIKVVINCLNNENYTAKIKQRRSKETINWLEKVATNQLISEVSGCWFQPQIIMSVLLEYTATNLAMDKDKFLDGLIQTFVQIEDNEITEFAKIFRININFFQLLTCLENQEQQDIINLLNNCDKKKAYDLFIDNCKKHINKQLINRGYSQPVEDQLLEFSMIKVSDLDNIAEGANSVDDLIKLRYEKLNFKHIKPEVLNYLLIYISGLHQPILSSQTRDNLVKNERPTRDPIAAPT